MSEAMTSEVLLPVAVLMALGWLVPWALGRVTRRSLAGLALNAAVSAVLLLGLGMALFAWLYGPAAGLVWREAPGAFLSLSARAALVWGPVAALSVANLPRRWPASDWEAPGARGDRGA